MFKKSTIVVIILSITLPAMAVDEKIKPGVAITIYNNNFAVVKERREMQFNKGVNTVKFTDVASLIDPTSVIFKSLTDADAVSILEQNYEYDLVNTASLLKRYIDKEVTIHMKGFGSDHGTIIEGILTAAMGADIILESKITRPAMQIISRANIEQIALKERPEDLVTKPTLIWLAQADAESKHLVQVTYTTGGVSWNADYTAILNAKDTALDFSGWVTINNQSGAKYQDANIKLIAGDVKRVQPRKGRLIKSRSEMEYSMMADSAGFQEKSFMEYHMYTLGRPSTIKNRQTKQIEFVEPVENIPAEKKYIYEWQKSPKKVQVKIEFENKEENGLGIALPKGKIRVFKKDEADGMLEFVGEDQIDHTPRKEKLSLYIGDAFDIVPEHTILDSKYSQWKRVETHKVQFRNRKDEPVVVYVDHKLLGSYWKWSINKTDFEYEKIDAFTARFKIEIPADSAETLEFTTTETSSWLW